MAQSSASPYTVLTASQCQDVAGAGGSTGSLADVAAYYYNTDLRTTALSNCTGAPVALATTGNEVCANNVPANGIDSQNQQHMTTYTIGLGVRGRMVYDSSDYLKALSGDYFDVTQGATAGSGICSWQTSGACNWPVPGISGSDGKIENVDDLWHAAVNGHGYYYSASDASTLVTSLKDFVAKVDNPPKPGTAAAAASSNPNITGTDNYVFSSMYTSTEWYGEVSMQKLDADTAVLSDVRWNAKDLLAQKMQFSDLTKRTIYVYNGGLQKFTWANLSSEQQANFSVGALTYSSATSGLSQFCTSGSGCLDATQQAAAAGANLVNYLRGDHTYEINSDPKQLYYRPRPCASYMTAVTGEPAPEYPATDVHPAGSCVGFTNGVKDETSGKPQPYVLGDIVASEARYVKKPQFQYTDGGYGAFVAEKANRTGMVYVGANDGMLHAFNADTGDEVWTYIPSLVLPNLYKLADMDYANKHQYYVDGTPEVGDIFYGTKWKTMLVGGLNLGGKGFYALDVTDPANPVYMWEFTDPNMGYSFGNPKFGKLSDGTWVVLLTSGYNNADGNGYVFVVNAETGKKIGDDIATGVGTAASPSGLARIAVRLNSLTDPTIKAAYGGDLMGNVWRFDVNNNVAPDGNEAQLLVTLKDAGGKVQPITAKPTVTLIGDVPVVYIGTGQLFNKDDIDVLDQQSFYAIKDNLDTNTFANPRSTDKFVKQTAREMACPAAQVTAGACQASDTVRGIVGNDCQAMDWATKNGWYVDFLTPGERSYTDSSIGLGSLVFTTNNPIAKSGAVCGDPRTIDSGSFRYTQDYMTGCSVKGSDSVVGINLGAGLGTRPNLVLLPNGTLYSMIRLSDPIRGPQTLVQKVNTAPTGQPPRRVSWRELFTE